MKWYYILFIYCADSIHFYRPRSEGDNVLGSVRPSVCLSVCQFVLALLFEPFDDIRGSALPSAATSKEESLPVSGVCLCVSNQWACADYCAYAVDRLLILHIFH